MFEALPVVIPTLRDVARGTLRPPAPGDAPDTAPQTPTAAILLDAAVPTASALGTLYDELDLYLQAASIATLRLHRRQPTSLAQMLDILAAVTLLRSQGYERVILIVAAEGAIPSWERSRAETLAGMLEVVRRHHSGSAAELIGSIEDLVRTIRGVADSVIGVATILVRSPGLSPARTLSTEPSPRPNRPGRRRSPVRMRSGSPSPSSSSPVASPKALAVSLRPSESTVSVVSQLYLWCRALAKQAPGSTHLHARAVEDAEAPEMLERERAVTRQHAVGAEFHMTVQWLEEQWSALIGDVARRTPRPTALVLAAMSRGQSRPASPAAPRGDTSTPRRDCGGWSFVIRLSKVCASRWP